MILNRTIVDTQRQEASPINQTDDIKRQSMTEGVYPQSRESLQLPAMPKFGKSKIFL